LSKEKNISAKKMAPRAHQTPKITEKGEERELKVFFLARMVRKALFLLQNPFHLHYANVLKINNSISR
jgi:hypothetical protein